MYKTKSEKRTTSQEKMILIYIFYQIILIIGEYVLLGGLKLGYEVFDVYVVDAKYIEYSSDEDFILHDRHE